MLEPKQHYIGLMTKLKKVHRRLLELERLEAESHFGRKMNPFEFFQILTQDKNFEWLRPFTKMIADLDGFLDEVESSDIKKQYVEGEISKVLSMPRVKERFERHKDSDTEFAALDLEFTKAMAQQG